MAVMGANGSRGLRLTLLRMCCREGVEMKLEVDFLSSLLEMEWLHRHAFLFYLFKGPPCSRTQAGLHVHILVAGGVLLY